MTEPADRSDRSDGSDRFGSLIDLHLGRLPAEEADSLRAAMNASPELHAQSEGCRRLLSALDAYEAPTTPSRLVDAILNRIAESEALIPFPSVDSAEEALPNGVERTLAGSAVLSLRELITIAACIVLFVGIFVPGYYKAQAISKRNLCAENMSQIYAGLGAYAQANSGYLPNAGAIPGGSWLPVRIPGVLRASNTRHIYLLLKDGYVNNARIFLCPGRGDGVPMLMDNYRKATDFAEPASNCNYSIQNGNVEDPTPLEQLQSHMAYVADANPNFSGQVTRNLNPFGPDNSNAHDINGGQNVLYVNGRVAWVTKPTVGVNGDHIYRAGTLTHYIGTELPRSKTDSFLVP
jgi:hypothetical protein